MQNEHPLSWPDQLQWDHQTSAPLTMQRPLSYYLIITWFFISLITIPYSFKAVTNSLIGSENINMLAFVVLVLATILSVKLFKCDIKAIWFAVVLFGLIVFFKSSQHLWLMITHWQKLGTNHLPLMLMIWLNFFCLFYLLHPKNRARLATIRTQIEADEARQFQRQTMNKL